MENSVVVNGVCWRNYLSLLHVGCWLFSWVMFAWCGVFHYFTYCTVVPFSKLDNWLNTKGFHADETRTSNQPAIAGRSLVNQRLNQRSDLIAGSNQRSLVK